MFGDSNFHEFALSCSVSPKFQKNILFHLVKLVLVLGGNTIAVSIMHIPLFLARVNMMLLYLVQSLEGISDIRDESDRSGMRIVIEVCRILVVLISILFY